jgi:hypothetical protein
VDREIGTQRSRKRAPYQAKPWQYRHRLQRKIQMTVRWTRSPSLLRTLVLAFCISIMTAGVAGAGSWHYSGWGTPYCKANGGYWAWGSATRHSGDARGELINFHIPNNGMVHFQLRAKALPFNNYGYNNVWTNWQRNIVVTHDCGAVACNYIGCQVSVWY